MSAVWGFLAAFFLAFLGMVLIGWVVFLVVVKELRKEFKR